MEEIKIYLDQARKNEVGETIEFKPVHAGKKETRSMFIENMIKYPLMVNILTEDKKLKIANNSYLIMPGATQKVDIEFSFSMEEVEPVKATIKLKVNWTAR